MSFAFAELPGDIIGRVLGLTDNDTVASFACCGSAALREVRASRGAILACRSPEFGASGRRRVLAAAAGFFPPALGADILQTPCWTAHTVLLAWPHVPAAATEHLDVQPGGALVLLDGEARDSLESLHVPACTETVELLVGGLTVLLLHGPAIRALAGADAGVDLLPHSVGKLPLGALMYHETQVRLVGARPARATFAAWDPALKAEALQVQVSPYPRPSVLYSPRVCMLDTQPAEDLKDGSVHVPYWLCRRSQALLIVVTRKDGGGVAEDALSTVTVTDHSRGCEVTIEARLLAAGRWRGFPGVWQGARAGYVWPLELGCDIDRVQVRLGVRAGVDAAALRVTLAAANLNRMTIAGGMGGLSH